MQDFAANGSALVCPKNPGKWCEHEAAIFIFTEDADAGERTQDPAERARVGTSEFRKFSA
ncbi:MAG: hypothetical protein ABIG80_02750 [Patescibacteria group bacterium]